jgi:methionyl-tRNA synthetase
LPDRYVMGKCPNCGAENQYSDLCEKCGRVPSQILDPVCGICGRSPIKKSSTHYFFKLSNFSKQLKLWLKNNENLQRDVANYVINWIDEGLKDWDITRDLSWGVPIPLSEAKGKVFYGWFDNHLCYISTFLTFFQKSGRNGKEFWNSSEIYHFIGKDIIYHHYLFLPAMRMGLDEEYKLPDYLPTRGHLMLHNQKISKSRSWYIGLREFISAFNPDYLRFYIASITPYSQSDINFDWTSFFEKINNELIANIGNFVNRALTFTQKKFNGKVPQPTSYDTEDLSGIEEIKIIPAEVGSLLSHNECDKALKRILRFTTHFNQYLQKKKPWSNISQAPTTMYIAVNAVRSIAIMLEPFIPFSSEKIWSQLGMSGTVHNQQWQSLSELQIPAGHTLGTIKVLFRKIELSEIEEQKAKLGKRDE